MSDRGIGKIYKRARSRFWQIELWVRGKRYTESAKSTRKADAVALLEKRIEQFRLVPGLMPRCTVGELLDDYLLDLEFRGARALGTFRHQAEVVRGILGSEVAMHLEPVRLYEAQQELRKRYAPATVNFIIGLVRSAFRHGARNGKIERRLEFPRALPANNARKGFLEHGAYLAILGELPEWAGDMFRLAYATGWRRGEVLSLTWPEVDMEAREIRLDPARSKNREGRVFPFLGEIGDVISRQHAERRLGVPWLFHHQCKPWSASTLNKTFREAATIAGYPKALIHDCRRTAIRNLLRAGVRADVAMAMVGWKTRAMMERYAIISEADLREAAAKAQEFMDRKHIETAAMILPFKLEPR